MKKKRFLNKNLSNFPENISLGDGLVYPTKSQHLSTVYESINNSPSSRVDIERGDEIKPLGTVLIDVAEHTTENNRNKSDNVL